MIKELIKISNKLDLIGLTKEADELDGIIRKMSQTRVNMDPDQISEDYFLAGDDHPLDAGGENSLRDESPEQRLIDLMAAVKIMQELGKKSSKEIAAHYGFSGDRKVIQTIEDMMTNPLYRAYFR